MCAFVGLTPLRFINSLRYVLALRAPFVDTMHIYINLHVARNWHPNPECSCRILSFQSASSILDGLPTG